MYNVLDVTLMADAFEHFRNATLNTFGVDSMHYITTPQMAYSLFLKVTMEGDHGENALKTLGEKCVQYITRINVNEVLTERNLEKIFMDHMGEFYGNKGIRLIEKNEIDDFIRILKNLRGGITQIVKRHVKIDIDNKEQATVSKEDIYYLDANNLYGGAMHRIMPYELVGVPQREQVMEKINRNPIKWIQSLNTFYKYGYFIEYDIETPTQLHDKFNELPFFPVQKAGMYSDESRDMLKRMISWTK